MGNFVTRFRIPLGLLAFFAVSTCAGRLNAGDFFGLTAVGSGGTTVIANGSNIINLANNLINQQAAFASLAGQNVTGHLAYGGIPNALIFTENAAQSQATLTIPSTGFTRTFTATASSDLQSQIENFIKSDSQQAYAQFLASIDRTSAVATLDGNPQSSTALIADSAFERFGIQNNQSQEPKAEGNNSEISVLAGGGDVHADGLAGSWGSVNVDSATRFTDNVALSLDTNVDYRQEGGSEAYTVAEEVGLPITIINNTGDGLSWQVAPWAFGGLSASYDQAAGVVLVGGGGTSSLAVHLGDFTLTVADQISYAGDEPVNVNGYGFDVAIDQWILKNGADLAYQPHGTPFFVDASVAYSNFLRPAAIPDYWTPSVGVGIKFDKYSGLRVAYEGDFASGYNANGGEVTLFLSF